MKYTITLISFVGLLAAMPAVLADETETPEKAAESAEKAIHQVDFSKAYVIIPEIPPSTAETENAETQDAETQDAETENAQTENTQTLRIGGVETREIRGDEVTPFNWILSLDFNTEDGTFDLQTLPQDESEVELLQQRLRGTVWTGEYKTANNLYSTELRFKAVQKGFVGAEIIHETKENPELSSFLHAKVAGDITTQYLIDEEGDGESVWVDVSRYKEIVKQINEDNEDKEGDDIAPIPAILDIRHLIRLKRTWIIEEPKHATSRWGSHSEYRLTLEDNKITGGVGTPPESYGAEDALAGNGEIELTRIEKPVETPPPPAPSALE